MCHPRAVRRRRRAWAALLLGLLLALHAAAAFPALHHGLHADGDEDSGCPGSECVVVAYASGTLEAGPIPVPLVRPTFAAFGDGLRLGERVLGARHDPGPPGRGPPSTGEESPALPWSS